MPLHDLGRASLPASWMRGRLCGGLALPGSRKRIQGKLKAERTSNCWTSVATIWSLPPRPARCRVLVANDNG
jgi:hypothetical protein